MIKYLKSYVTRPDGCSHFDWLNLQLFAAALFVPFFIIYGALLTDGQSFMVTVMTYLVLTVVTMYIGIRQMRPADVIILISFYVFIALNFLLDPSRSEFFFNPDRKSVV